MATVLFTWELGGGLGHLVNLLPLARGLVERGHRVVAAVRELARVRPLFSGVDVSWLQAPVRLRRSDNRIEPPRTFVHILHNCGFGDFDELYGMTDAWRTLYDYVQPDLIVFEHSPTALLASRGYGAKRALVGNGFFSPPDVCPLPDLRPWLGDDTIRICRDEAHVVANVDRLLVSWAESPLDRLAHLYQQVDANFLLTFPELDHYPRRSGGEYFGAWPNVGGKMPLWPSGQGKKIFAYLKPFPALTTLLDLLRRSQCPTLILSDGIDTETMQRFAGPTVRFERTPLDLHDVASQCDLAILNGNHGTTISMLLAGKPTLQLPLFLEQTLSAAAVARLGAGVSASPASPEQITALLTRLLSSDEHADAARRFAARHAAFDPRKQIDLVLGRLEALLPRTNGCGEIATRCSAATSS